MKTLGKTIAGLTLASCCPLQLLAADPIETPNIVITPTRVPEESARVAASPTVITREDIEARQFESVEEVLRSVPGVTVVQNGGPGKNVSIFLRGTESDHVLVLLNGIRVGSATLGTASLQHIPLEHIERVEVVRGPLAHHWGSEAIGGVIHFFTRQGRGSNQYELGAGAGSYSTIQGHAAFGGESGGTHYQGTVAYYDSDGFDAREPVSGDFPLDQPDDDGYDNLSFHLRGGHNFDNGVSVDAFALRADGTTEFDGSFQDETDFVQQVVGAEAKWRDADRKGLALKIGESRDETENFAPDGSFASRFDTKRLDSSLIGDIVIAETNRIVAGIDYRDDKIDSDQTFPVTSRDNLGAFAQYLGTFGAHEISASIRGDDNEAFGSKTTGGLGWVFNTANAFKFYATYGTAFKTPTFNELYFPDFGNPDLGPEESESIELGIEQRYRGGSWGVSVFRNEIDDLIATALDPATGLFSPLNVDEARITGLEANASLFFDGWEFTGALTLLDHEDRATGNKLARRPDAALSLDLAKMIGKLRTGGRLTAQDKRFDDAANTIEVDGFVTFDFYADYEIRPGLFLKAKIDNVFDEDYQTADTFNAPGRNVLFSVLYKSQP